MSTDNAILSGFEKITGLKIIDSFVHSVKKSVTVMGKNLQYTKDRSILLTPTTTTVLLNDLNGNPLLTVNEYGKGKVYYLNFSLEDSLIDTENAFDKGYETIYKTVFADRISQSPVAINNQDTVFTLHPNENGYIVVVLNHSNIKQTPIIELRHGYKINRFIYGTSDLLPPWDGIIFTITKT